MLLQWVYSNSVYWLFQLTLSKAVLLQRVYSNSIYWLLQLTLSTAVLPQLVYSNSIYWLLQLTLSTAVLLQRVYSNSIYWLLQLTLSTDVLLQWVWVPDKWGGWQWRQSPPVPSPTLPQTLHCYGRDTKDLVLWLLGQVWHLLQRTPHGQVWRLLCTYTR